MTVTSSNYSTSNQAITCTLNSLGNTASRSSASISAASGYIDAFIFGKLATAAGTVVTGSASFYAYGTVDGGVTFTDEVPGTDAAFIPNSPTNLRLIGIGNVNATSGVYHLGPYAVAPAFGGFLPQIFGIVVTNNSGGTLSGAGNLAYAQYVGLQNN